MDVLSETIELATQVSKVGAKLRKEREKVHELELKLYDHCKKLEDGDCNEKRASYKVQSAWIEISGIKDDLDEAISDWKDAIQSVSDAIELLELGKKGESGNEQPENNIAAVPPTKTHPIPPLHSKKQM